jgi:hypothetical protein
MRFKIIKESNSKEIAIFKVIQNESTTIRQRKFLHLFNTGNSFFVRHNNRCKKNVNPTS